MVLGSEVQISSNLDFKMTDVLFKRSASSHNQMIILKYTLVQGFSNFFGWRPLNLSEKSYDPLNVRNTKLKP
jgi:hypothetical protein